MKIRVINQNGLFVPQFQKKGYYGSTSWNGFGTPLVKFTNKQKALDFVELVEESVGGKKVLKKDEVIYTNYAPEGKIYER